VAVKDQAALVSAASRLVSAGCRLRVVIAGEGPLREQLEQQIASLGLGQVVQLLGHRGDLESVLAALDVYVLCSRSEGMPNTILEAMASGVAVVSTHVGGADELVEHGRTGLLVPAGRADLLAEAIGELIADPDRRREMGAAGRARAHDTFSLAMMVRAYEMLYLRGAGAER
jgi:glycosyltransferase involved in cell wall biosynthesis